MEPDSLVDVDRSHARRARTRTDGRLYPPAIRDKPPCTSWRTADRRCSARGDPPEQAATRARSARLGDGSIGYLPAMTARTNDLLAHAHGLAGGASNIAAHVSDAIGSAVGDAASAVADTATHAFESITSSIDHAIGRAPKHRSRTWIPVVLGLAIGAALFSMLRRRGAGGSATTTPASATAADASGQAKAERTARDQDAAPSSNGKGAKAAKAGSRAGSSDAA
jgi:hypothetical protein